LPVEDSSTAADRITIKGMFGCLYLLTSFFCVEGVMLSSIAWY